MKMKACWKDRQRMGLRKYTCIAEAQPELSGDVLQCEFSISVSPAGECDGSVPVADA